jgi:Secretory lipase
VHETLLAAGYAIVVTDYDGIGTPGESSVVDGPSQAYAMIDIVRAARTLAPLSRQWAGVGDSLGGYTALFAAYAPEPRHVGTVGAHGGHRRAGGRRRHGRHADRGARRGPHHLLPTVAPQVLTWTDSPVGRLCR